LDADLPAHGATQPDLKTMVTFTFTDHIVALMYDAATETLTVVQPDTGSPFTRHRDSSSCSDRANAATLCTPIPELPFCVSV